CADHAVSQLVLIEGLPAVVALDQARHYQFRRLERGETLVAVEALAPPAHLPPIGGQARIDHLGFFVTAKGTVHAIRLALRSIIHERHQRQEAEPRLGGGLARTVANRDVCAEPPWMGSRRSWQALPPAEAPPATNFPRS